MKTIVAMVALLAALSGSVWGQTPEEQRAMERGQRALEAYEKRMKELEARIKQLDAKINAPREQLKIEPLSPEAIEIMQATIRRALKDPDSASFGDIIGGRNADGVLNVCGWVNAKNSFGGYTGMQPFMGFVMERPSGSPDKKPVGFVPLGIGAEDSPRVFSSCKAQGLALQ
jgi:hypothetical protein